MLTPARVGSRCSVRTPFAPSDSCSVILTPYDSPDRSAFSLPAPTPDRARAAAAPAPVTFFSNPGLPHRRRSVLGFR